MQNQNHVLLALFSSRFFATKLFCTTYESEAFAAVYLFWKLNYILSYSDFKKRTTKH